MRAPQEAQFETAVFSCWFHILWGPCCEQFGCQCEWRKVSQIDFACKSYLFLTMPRSYCRQGGSVQKMLFSLKLSNDLSEKAMENMKLPKIC